MRNAWIPQHPLTVHPPPTPGEGVPLLLIPEYSGILASFLAYDTEDSINVCNVNIVFIFFNWKAIDCIIKAYTYTQCSFFLWALWSEVKSLSHVQLFVTH